MLSGKKVQYSYPEGLVVGWGAVVSRPSELRKRKTAARGWYLRNDGSAKNIRKKRDKV